MRFPKQVGKMDADPTVIQLEGSLEDMVRKAFSMIMEAGHQCNESMTASSCEHRVRPTMMPGTTDRAISFKIPVTCKKTNTGVPRKDWAKFDAFLKKYKSRMEDNRRYLARITAARLTEEKSEN